MQTVTATVGINTVAGAWAYQGSRPVVRSSKILNAQGKNLNALDAKTGRVLWKAEATGHEKIEGQQVFSPPALGQEQMYLGSGLGFVVSVRQKDGKTGFLYALKHPVAFQPALARGNIYVGTTDGLLICLRTGDSDADGWYAWGGNAQHNR
jgi:outer membrane protein assembly factor BamB